MLLCEGGAVRQPRWGAAAAAALPGSKTRPHPSPPPPAHISLRLLAAPSGCRAPLYYFLARRGLARVVARSLMDVSGWLAGWLAPPRGSVQGMGSSPAPAAPWPLSTALLTPVLLSLRCN